MSEFGRRTFLRCAAALATSLASPAHAKARFRYKYGNNLPATHPLNRRAAEAAQRIRIATDGELDIRIFPSNQLGGDTGMLNQLRAGALEFFTPSSLGIATLVPAAAINAVGFAFPDYETVWAAMDGDLGAFIAGEIEKVGLHMMARVWDNGFRQITTSGRPVNTPHDLHGKKIRVPVSRLPISLFETLGATPTGMQFSEVYTALQTHVVDGQENPLPIIDAAKLYEVQNCTSLTNHIWDGYLFVASGEAWYRLPKEIRAIAESIFNSCGVAQRADVAALNASVRADLTSRGMAFVKPDPALFVATLKEKGFYRLWRERFGEAAWNHLEKYVGRLG
jgi:tripartite ATP-independent transporter DctP family solute receptor